MRRGRVGSAAKGWITGPWEDAALPLAVGWAAEAIDEPHLHRTTTELYVVVAGAALLRVESETLELAAGDVVLVEPGEAHTFLRSTGDYRHVVVHAPALAGAEARADKVEVPRARFDLP